ncbi:MAG: hypothetical protein FJ279_25735 [Planctomycetes bacterium]|nr:hypothetical protein [Planctomycetota bacterium]MBM4079603.1 hypothetical protein [Planctomycetota bacterium]MBM4083861.1 hypothetical protein [Planctomycetota bacterium]
MRIAILPAVVAAVLSVCVPVLARELHVSPTGAPEGDGRQERPLDLATALTSERHVKPGDTVWLSGGTYQGPFNKPASPAGTETAPIIYRAAPGQRVTLTANDTDRTVLEIQSSHVWFWGLEVTVNGKPEQGHYGAGVSLRGGREIKLINMVVHDCPNRSGIGGSNLGSEFYGCLVYRNGQWGHAQAHGTYTQNRPEDVGGDLAALPWKTHRDCVIFNNFGFGVHSYATAPRLANLLFEGVVAFGNGLPQGAEKPTVNFLAGGRKFDDHVIVRDCFTYFPREGDFKRGADFGYHDQNGRLTIERSRFIGGADAVWICRWQEATVKSNVFFTARGRDIVLLAPENHDPKHYRFEDNLYYRGTPGPFQFNNAPFASLEAWQRATGLDMSSRIIDSPPTEPWVFLRPNKYEPNRALLIVYNWPGKPEVIVRLDELWNLKPGEKFTIVNVEDIWAKPVVEATFQGEPLSVTMSGSYAPEFACYLVTK